MRSAVCTQRDATDRRITVETKAVCPDWEPRFVPLLQTQYSDVDSSNPAKLTAQLNGTGYYKFINYDKAQQKYPPPGEPGLLGGPPKTPKLTFWIIPDLDARLSALQAGDVMVIPRVTAEQVMAIAGDPAPDDPQHALRRYGLAPPDLQESSIRKAGWETPWCFVCFLDGHGLNAHKTTRGETMCPA